MFLSTAATGSAAETAAALLKGADGAQKIDLAEGGPQDVGKIKFAVGALPQEKAREADFPARANDQIGVGQARGVQMAGNGLGGDFVDRLGQGRLFLSRAAEQRAHCVGDFLAPAV